MNSVPTPVFIGIALDYSRSDNFRFGIYVHDGHWSHDYHESDLKFINNTSKLLLKGLEKEEAINNEIIIFLNKYKSRKNCKILIAGLVNSSNAKLHKLGRRLWFELDILPLVLDVRGITLNEKACSAARKTNQWTSLSNIPGLCRIKVGYRHEVEVDAKGNMAYCNLEDYQRFFKKKVGNRLLEHQN